MKGCPAVERNLSAMKKLRTTARFMVMKRSSQKAWKDAAYGAALSVDPEVESVTSLLDQGGVAESPLGRVPKQNPDRTISSESRPINDMRRQNEAGSKFNHPLRPSPDITLLQDSHSGGGPDIQVYRRNVPSEMFLERSSGISYGQRMSRNWRLNLLVFSSSAWLCLSVGLVHQGSLLPGVQLQKPITGRSDQWNRGSTMWSHLSRNGSWTMESSWNRWSATGFLTPWPCSTRRCSSCKASKGSMLKNGRRGRALHDATPLGLAHEF